MATEKNRELRLTCPSEHQLHDFQRGELPEKVLNEVAEHLEHCSQCEARARQLDGDLDPIIAVLRNPGSDARQRATQFLGAASDTPSPRPGAGPATPAVCPGPERLQAFALGTLVAAEMPAVQQHLRQCGDCLAFLWSLRGREVVAQLLDGGRHLFTTTGEGSKPESGRSNAEPGASESSYSFLRPPERSDEIGRLGNYRILRLLGKGGMAYVFDAEDMALGRAVALKVKKPNLDFDAEAWQRFLREARIMAAIKHEHVVTIFQAGHEGDVVFLAMERLAGESLDDWMQRVGRADIAQVMRLGREIASGLAVVHRNGLIHRDIKPDNIWLEAPHDSPPSQGGVREGRVKLLDFGLARYVNDDARLTRTGTIMGTPSFMSPEQARGDRVDLRTDLFSLGSVLYNLCTGKHPFRDENTMAVLTALAIDTPRPVHELNPAVPRSLSNLVMQLLAKDPSERPPSAEAVVERLQQIDAWLERPGQFAEPTGDSRPRWFRRRRPLQLGVGLGLAVLAGFLLLQIWSLVAPSNVVYLSDMTPIAKENWPFSSPGPPPDGKKGKGPPEGKGGKGPPPDFDAEVRVKRVRSPHGIFMHPPPPPLEGSPASLTYRLGKQYSTFKSQVSMNDGPPRCESPCFFSVYGDGKLLWKSSSVTSQADGQDADVPVDGVEVLKIEVSCPGRDIGGAHMVWIEPHVTK